MRISLTERVSIEANGTRLDETRFPGRQGRLVFAYLLAEQGRPVPRDELAEALWGEAAPATWEKALAVLVSKLRALLEECGVDGQAALKSAFGCYQLILPDGAWIDVAAATQNAERAEAALARGDLAEAQASAAEAATLARRTFLPGEYGSWVEEKRRELQDLLVRALECRVDACLKAGDAGEAVKYADEVTALEPFRESGYRRLMRAHSAAGNNAEALRVYERCRRLLADELGAFPSPDTESTYLEILRMMPAETRAPVPAVQAPESEAKKRLSVTRTRLAALGIAGGAVAAAAVVIAVTRSSGPDFLPRLDANAVGVIDAEAAGPAAQVALGSRPAALAAGGGFLWVASEDGTVSRVDPRTRAVRTVDVGQSAGGVVYESQSVWATKPDERAVAQINPDTLAVVQTIAVGNGPGAISAGGGVIWVANTIDGTVSRIDLTSGVPLTVPVGERPAAIAVGAGAVWVANQAASTVLRLDPRSGAIVAAIEVGNGPSGIAVGEGGVWVANRQDGTISRIDPATDSVSATIPGGANPTAVAFGAGAIWVASSGDGRIARIEPGEGRPDKSISVESSPSALALTDGKLWVMTLPSLSSHRGGVLRVESTPLICPCGDPASPGFNVSVVNLAYDGLLAYRRVGGVGGGEVVGNLAVRVPTPTDKGKTYSFQLRRDVRYSNGAPVRASDFRYSLERLLTINRGHPTAYDAIVGAAKCALRSPRRCDLSKGIEVDDRASRVTIHLTQADPDFLYKLTLPGASFVPSGTPIRLARERPIPGTGPYRVASLVPRRGVRLTRNPYFHVWSYDARPEGYPAEIRFHFSDDADARLAAVARGDADWVTELAPGRLKGLLTRYADQLHSDPAPSTDYMFLNTRVPPFDDFRVRRALNYAVDRDKIVELAGGELVARATCQLLPPRTPGYRPYCPYTLKPNAAGTWTAPDLAKAKALIAASGTRGARVEVFAYDVRGRTEYGRYFVALLRRLGYRSSLRVIPAIPDYVHYAGDSRRRAQIGTFGWYADFSAPSLFLQGLFNCASFRPETSSNLNLSEFCDSRIDARMLRASVVQTSDPTRANALWADVDRALVDRAAALPLVDRNAVVFVSRRVGNYQFHPQWGTLLDQLWVK